MRDLSLQAAARLDMSVILSGLFSACEEQAAGSFGGTRSDEV